MIKPEHIKLERGRFKRKNSISKFEQAAEILARENVVRLAEIGIKGDFASLKSEWLNDLKFLWDYEKDCIRE